MTVSAEKMIGITRTLVGCLQAMLPLGNSEGVSSSTDEVKEI